MNLWVKRLIGLIVLALLYGASLLIAHWFTGGRTISNYVGFVLLGGIVLVIGELLAEKIMSKDQVTDSPFRRLAKLAILLLSAGTFMLLLLLLRKYFL